MPEDLAGGGSPESKVELAAPSESEPITPSQYETSSPSETSSLPNRFRAALYIYVVLAAFAWFTLDGRMRDATLLLLGGIAFKSWLGVLKDRQR